MEKCSGTELVSTIRILSAGINAQNLCLVELRLPWGFFCFAFVCYRLCQRVSVAWLASGCSFSSQPGAFSWYTGKISHKEVVRKTTGTGAERKAVCCRNTCWRYRTFVCYQLSQTVKASNLQLCNSHLTLLDFHPWRVALIPPDF